MRNRILTICGLFVALAGMTCGKALAADPPAAPTPAPTSTANATPSATPTITTRVGDPLALNKPEQFNRIKAAVDQLILESKDLDNLGVIKQPLYFTRPHPLLSAMGSDMSMEVLDRMLQPFTDNEYRDTYIRWHLLWVVKKVSEADRRATAPKLVQLFRIMPGPLDIGYKAEWYYDPVANWRKYSDIMGTPPGGPDLVVVVGYPPFQTAIHAPASIKYATADQVNAYNAYVAAYPALLAAWKKKSEETFKLFPFKHIRDKGTIAFNQRLRYMYQIMREYRGELMYAIISAGDPETGKLVMSELGRLAKARNGIAFDLLSFLYLAAFDEALNRYDDATLSQMSDILQQGAMASEGYYSYGGQMRNFADSAFHMVMMLRDGGGFAPPDKTENSTSPGSTGSTGSTGSNRYTR